MSTVAKGEKYESYLFSLLSDLIETDNFPGYKRDYLKIYRKKAYHSHKRKAKITFDVVVEVTFPTKAVPHMILIFECKHYSNRVSVDDVEEFESKINQVEDGRVKGVFVSNAELQSAAFQYLKSNGIAYIKLLPEKPSLQIEDWVLTRLPKNFCNEDVDKQVEFTIFSDIWPSRFPCVGCFIGENYSGFNLLLFLIDLLAESEKVFCQKKEEFITQKMPSVPFISKEELENFSIKIRQLIPKLVFGRTLLEEICRFESDNNGLIVTYESNCDTSLLGSISFASKEIKIFTHSNRYRQNFTLAHELAHYYLNHGQFLDSEKMSRKHWGEVPSYGIDLPRLEWQANYLASCILLPRQQVSYDFMSLVQQLELRNRGYGYLYLDDQPCNIQNFKKIANILQQRYGASFEAIQNRLISLNLVTVSEKCYSDFHHVIHFSEFFK